MLPQILFRLLLQTGLVPKPITPCEENGGQSSSLTFYGSSFIADATGELVASAGRDTEEILYASFDLDALREERFSWGLFRDRRPETYRIMTKQ